MLHSINWNKNISVFFGRLPFHVLHLQKMSFLRIVTTMKYFLQICCLKSISVQLFWPGLFEKKKHNVTWPFIHIPICQGKKVWSFCRMRILFGLNKTFHRFFFSHKNRFSSESSPIFFIWFSCRMRRWEWWVAALLAAVVVPASPQGALHFLFFVGGFELIWQQWLTS